MSIKGYRQVMEVTTAVSLPMSAKEGEMAFADDDKHYYVFRSGVWVQIPTAPEVQEWLEWKADIADLKPVAFSGDYDDLTDKPSIPSSQVQTDWAQSNSSAVDFIKNKPPSPSQSAATRGLNNAFQVSVSRNSQVVYTVSISNTVSLSGGSAGGVVLEIATNAAFTTGVQELSRVSNSNTGTLVIGLVLTDAVSQNLKGYVPAGYYVRLRTFNTTGTPTYAYISGQEVWL